MKRIKSVLAVILVVQMLLICTGCGIKNTNNENIGTQTEPPNKTEETTETKTEETTETKVQENFYVEKNDNASIFLINHSENLSSKLSEAFADANKFGSLMDSEKVVFDDISAKQKDNPLNSSDKLEYLHSDCKKESSLSDSYGKYYSIYDVYKSSLGRYEYLHDSDLLCYYLNDREYTKEPLSTPYSEDEAKLVAETFLLNIMSEDALAGYEYRETNFNIPGSFMCVVYYSCHILGYPTDDSLSVFINEYGEVGGFNGYNSQKYDKLLHSFSKEDLDNASKALTDKLNALNLNDLEINSPSITTDTNGHVYIKVKISFADEDGMACAEYVYANVN